MNVLMVTCGSSGDVHPYVGITRALQARGHEVTFVTNQQNISLLERCGISSIALPNSKLSAAPACSLFHRIYIQLMGLVARRCLKFTRRSTVLPLFRPMYDAIAEHCRRKPSVVIANLANYSGLGARIAQDHLGIPTITTYLSPASGLRSVYQPPIAPPLMSAAGNSIQKNQRAYQRADRFVFDPVLAGPINRLRAELGLESCRGILAGWQNSPDRVIGLFPEWFAPAQPDWPETLRLTGFPMYDERELHSLPVALERFLEPNDPPIVFTATSDAKKAKDYFRDCIRTTQELSARGLILTKYPDQLPSPLPNGFLHVDYAPFSRVLGRASALVHFAGIGSTSQALAMEIPQLMIPQKHDQHDTTMRIERLGVGRGIWTERKRAKQMVEGLHELLHSTTVRENCRRVAGLIDPPKTLNQICSLIEELQPRTIQRVRNFSRHGLLTFNSKLPILSSPTAFRKIYAFRDSEMLADRVSHFSESVIREMTRFAQRYGALNLGQGMPDFESPQEIKDAACRAIQAGFNQYAITWGAPALRQAIAEKARTFNGITCDPDRNVTVCCGATETMMATMLALVNPGDEVIIFQPFYENYGPDAIISGAKPVWVPLRPPHWQFDPQELRGAFSNRTKAIIVNTPNNPTGHVFTLKELSLIAELCQKYDAYALTDEIYEYIRYTDTPHISLATLPGMHDRTVTISGLSKTFSVTGWRLGYCIASAEISNGIRKAHDFLTVGAPHPLQMAGAEALKLPTSYYEKLKSDYRRRRDLFVPYLHSAGFTVYEPEGAYYVMTDIAELGWQDDTEFVKTMIQTVGVSAVPGSSFYNPKELGKTKVRFMFAKKDETLHQAGERLQKVKQMKVPY